MHSGLTMSLINSWIQKAFVAAVLLRCVVVPMVKGEHPCTCSSSKRTKCIGIGMHFCQGEGGGVIPYTLLPFNNCKGKQHFEVHKYIVFWKVEGFVGVNPWKIICSEVYKCIPWHDAYQKTFAAKLLFKSSSSMMTIQWPSRGALPPTWF